MSPDLRKRKYSVTILEERKWLINHAEEYGSKSTELFKAEGGPSKFEKLKKMAEILYSIRSWKILLG